MEHSSNFQSSLYSICSACMTSRNNDQHFFLYRTDQKPSYIAWQSNDSLWGLSTCLFNIHLCKTYPMAPRWHNGEVLILSSGDSKIVKSGAKHTGITRCPLSIRTTQANRGHPSGSCMWKRAISTFLRVCSVQRWCSMNSRWLVGRNWQLKKIGLKNIFMNSSSQGYFRVGTTFLERGLWCYVGYWNLMDGFSQGTHYLKVGLETGKT